MTSFTNLGDLIRRDRDLGKIAVIDLGGEFVREIIYRELDAMTNGVARALCGLSRGDRVGILSANRTEYRGPYYGIVRAGLVALPGSVKFPRSAAHFIVLLTAVELLVWESF